MKIVKYFTVLILVFGLCLAAVAEKRVKPMPMKEFTDPSSPSYVPHPYPKKRVEIIEDLKYAINILFADGEENNGESKTPEIKTILLHLLDEIPVYKVGEIHKVKNRSHRLAHDYTWLITIEDENGQIVARVAMTAPGLFASAGATTHGAELFKSADPSLRRGPHFLKTGQDVLNSLSNSMGISVSKNEIKKMERVAFQSNLGSLLTPMWEIKMLDGNTYYYSVKRDMVYEVAEKIRWKKDKDGRRTDMRSLVPRNYDFVPDTINDEILVLKKLSNGNQSNN